MTRQRTRLLISESRFLDDAQSDDVVAPDGAGFDW